MCKMKCIMFLLFLYILPPKKKMYGVLCAYYSEIRILKVSYIYLSNIK